MSITVRNYSKSELSQIEARDGSRETNRLTTVFFNGSSRNLREMNTLYRVIDMRRKFLVYFPGQDNIAIYATDLNALLWFLSKEYRNGSEVEIVEEVTQYINLSSWTIAPRDDF